MTSNIYTRYAFVSGTTLVGPTLFYRYRSGSVPREQSITDKRVTIEGKRSANTNLLTCSSTSSSSNSYDRIGTTSEMPRYARAASELPFRRHLGRRMEPAIRITGRF